MKSFVDVSNYQYKKLPEIAGVGKVSELKAANTLGNQSNTQLTRAADPFGLMTLSNLAAVKSGVLRDGVVSKSWPGLYSCVVTIRGMSYVCSVLNSTIASVVGYSECKLPVEGTRVLVYLPDAEGKHGYILGVLPYTDVFPRQDTKPERSSTVNPYMQELLDEFDGFGQEVTEKNTFNKSIDTSYRPISTLPGDYALLNLRMSGIVLSEFDVRLQAGASYININESSSTLEFNTLGFKHIEFSGTTNHFVDHGLISNETTFTPMQGEGFGGDSTYTKGTFTDSSTESKFKVKTAVELQTAKSRIKSFIGYLGNVFNFFIGRPDRNIKFLSMNDKPKDEGVLHANIDYDGRVAVRSAGGFSVERYDRIPVPFRKKYHWDPEGNQDDITQEIITPFETNEEYPHSRSLELSDRMALEFKRAYQRIDEYTKDFYIPEEGDSEIAPKNDANLKEEIKGGDNLTKSHDVEANDGKRSGIYLGDDGSVIIRDGWGSEIVMEGGTITMSSPSNINILPGKSLVMLAGDDLIGKAFNSIDMYATNHDFRLKAERNIHICAGSDDGEAPLGGILIESKADGIICDSGKIEDGGYGEDSISAGIYLKAPKSAIVHDSKHATYKTKKIHEVITQLFKVKSKVFISNSEGSTLLAGKEGTSFLVLSNSAALTADNASIVYGSSAMVFNGGKIPILWDGEDSPDLSALKKALTIFNKDSVLFSDEEFKCMFFSCRTSEQCDTIEGIEVDNKSKFFTINEPYWSLLYKLGYKYIKGVQTQPWTELPVNNSYPWPGKDAYIEKAKYLTVSDPGSANIQKDPKGTYIGKDRKEIKTTGSEITAKSFEDYIITK
jgi:hypothetical protein